MKTYELVVGWKHTIVDTAAVKVEAKNKKEALKMAKAMGEANKGSDGKGLDWRDGEVCDGFYFAYSSAKKQGKRKGV